MTIIELLKLQLVGKEILVESFKNSVKIVEVNIATFDGDYNINNLEYLLKIVVEDENKHRWLLKMNEEFHILIEE
jgi:hypothetical protein